MSVWLCIPSARPAEEVAPVLKLWREHGYNIALYRDDIGNTAEYDKFWRPGYGLTDLIFFPHWETPTDPNALLTWPYTNYPGYARSVNELVRQVIGIHDEFSNPKLSPQWIVCAGDDTEPDANHSAEDIARECELHFGAVAFGQQTRVGGTFGVMQCTGDRWGDQRNTHAPQIMKDGRCSVCGQPKGAAKHLQGAYIDRVAGSPWMGREFCLRVNQGRGPLWPEYYHMGCDEELQAVATQLGVFWQRPDLIHLHKHWGRGPGDKPGSAANMPDFLKRANSLEEWTDYKRLFAEREAAGFPGSEPL